MSDPRPLVPFGAPGDRRGPGATPRRGPAVLFLLALPLLAACAARSPSEPGPVAEGWSQVGVASWYGEPFHGRTTASGEVYDMEAMTAAHPSLPMGTRVRVTVLETGRQTRLRINDRGPFARGRIIDVSRAGARVLGFLREGTARVRVRVLSPASACHEVQVGSYAVRGNAVEMRDRLRDRGERARLEPGPRDFTRVVAGPYGSRDAAHRVKDRFGGLLRVCPGEA